MNKEDRKFFKCRKILPVAILIILLLSSFLYLLLCLHSPKEIVRSDNQVMLETTELETWEDGNMVNEKQYITDNAIELEKQKDIESSYVKDYFNGLNHYWIDENGILWGTGNNEYGQLGGGADLNEYTKPRKIAEKIIHISCDNGGRFLLMLSENHILYGIGANCEYALLQEPIADENYNPEKNIVNNPKILMENVIFAVAGKGNICALTEKGDVYWWGEFSVTTANTRKLSSMKKTTPFLMLKNAKYVTTGSGCAAAIDNENQLWMWGNNVWGQCGNRSEDEWITNPVLAAKEIEMVWVECLSSKKNCFDITEWEKMNPYIAICNYMYTTFVRTVDGKIMACGIDLAGEKKTVETFGDIGIDSYMDVGEEKSAFTHSYSSIFQPIVVVEYKREEDR